MGRWDIPDDARSLEQTSDRTPERTETIHHSHDVRIAPLRVKRSRISSSDRTAIRRRRATRAHQKRRRTIKNISKNLEAQLRVNFPVV